MSHLLLIRSCKSYVYGENLTYGTHEQIERNIARRKYPLNDVREGYNTPFATEYKFIDYRIKKEVLPKFVSDLRALNLNPYPNNTSLIGLFRSDKHRSIGRTFYLIQYLFKWLNRFPFKYLHPLKPVPVGDSIDIKDFRNDNWSYDFVIGCFDDPTERMRDPETGEEYKQEDVL